MRPEPPIPLALVTDCGNDPIFGIMNSFWERGS